MEIKQLVDQLSFCVNQVSLKENPNVNQTHTTLFKCLCNIILAFLTFFTFFKETNPEISNILQDTYNKLILLKTENRSCESKESVKIVHVKEYEVAAREGYTVAAHDVTIHCENTEEAEHERDLILEETERQLEEEKSLNQAATEEIEKLKAEIKQKDEEIIDLNLQVSSKTSHTPPSKDMSHLGSFKTYHNDRKEEHEQSGQNRKVGGQEGHPGVTPTVKQDLEPDKIINCYPEGMSKEEIDSLDWKEGAVHDVVGIVTRAEVTRYVQMETTVSGKHGPKGIKGNFPKMAWARVSYNESVRRAVFIDYMMGNMSVNRIRDVLRNRYGITIGNGTIQNFITEAAGNFRKVEKKIQKKLKEEAKTEDSVFSADETGVGVNGNLYWDHILVGPDLVLHHIHHSRGLKGSRDSGIFDHIAGSVVSDFFRNYLNRQFANAFCWAHLERDLYAAQKRTPDSQWLKQMQVFAKNSYLAYRESVETGKPIPKVELKALVAEYEKAILTGLDEEDMPKKNLNLLARFTDYKEGILAHLFDTRIPRTNNSAERAARSLKTRLDVSHMFKTQAGAENYTAFLSVVDSAKRKGLDPFEAIDQTIGGNLNYLFTGEKFDSLSHSSAKIMELQKNDKN